MAKCPGLSLSYECTCELCGTWMSARGSLKESTSIKWEPNNWHSLAPHGCPSERSVVVNRSLARFDPLTAIFSSSIIHTVCHGVFLALSLPLACAINSIELSRPFLPSYAVARAQGTSARSSRRFRRTGNWRVVEKGLGKTGSLCAPVNQTSRVLYHSG